MALKLVDQFTVRDGRWDVDRRPWGITPELLQKYGAEPIAGKGAAAHIFVKAKPGSVVRFFTDDATTPQSEPRIVDHTGWVSFFMGRGAKYWLPNQGPWHVMVNGVRITDPNGGGIGLPDGLHVSTYLVVEDVTDLPQPTPTQPPLVVGRQHIRIMVETISAEGVLLKSEVVWQS